MSQLQIVGLAVGLGPAFLLCAFFVGFCLGGRWLASIGSAWDRTAMALLIGIVVQALASAIFLAISPSAIWASLWLVVAASLAAWKFGRPDFRGSCLPLALVIGYAVLCFALLVSFHYSPARGATIFWSIYSMTNVTPGDSPQAAFQAQYLLMGDRLIGGQDFALFDRPFLGGLITAGALSSFGLRFDKTFYEYNDLLAFGYCSLWIAINSVCILSLLGLVRRFASARPALHVSVLVLACPFVVLNVIGLWPKLFALALIAAACNEALRERWLTAAMLAGLSFYAHGSFLWAHIAFCGVMSFAILARGLCQTRFEWKPVAGVIATCLVFPVAWFLAEHIAGGATPLRTYYLYNVDPAYGLTHKAQAIAHQFYASTTAANLYALPLMNLFKGVLPVEALDLIMNFGLSGQAISWRRLGENLFRLQFMRAWFAFGLIGGLITLRGAFCEPSKRWLPRLALIALFLLPLIPGLGLYRRDDHFLLPIMLFSAIPVIISFTIGMQQFRTGIATLLALTMLCEFLFVYVWRYPMVRYVHEFHAYYIVLATLAVLAAGVVILWPSARTPFWLTPKKHEGLQ